MAEQNSENNPFSFSKFLGRKQEFDFPLIKTSLFIYCLNQLDDVHAWRTARKKGHKGAIKENFNSEDSESCNPFSIRNFSPKLQKKPQKLQIIDDDDDDDNDKKSNFKVSVATMSAALTSNHDTDSDNDLFNLPNTPSPQMDSYILDDIPKSPDTDIMTKLDQLVLENDGLRNEMAKIKEEFLEYRQTANRRISGLQKELEKARKKEADETKALEDVVHMVEENLQFTTTRAVKAELTATKLKEELQLYKDGSVSKSEYEKLQKDHEYMLRTIQEKSKNTASLLKKAAERTEPHIRQLQSGLSALCFLSEQFEELGKIAELPSHDENVT